MQQVCPRPCPAYFLLFYSSVQGEKSWPHCVWSWRMTPFPAEEPAGRGMRCQLKSRGKPCHGEGCAFSQLPGASASPHACCRMHVGKGQKPGHGTKPPWVKLRLPTLFFSWQLGHLLAVCRLCGTCHRQCPARRLAARIGRHWPPPSRQLPWEPSVAEGHLSLQSPALQQCRYFPFGPAEGHGLGWGCVIYGCWNESLHARREDPFSPLDLMHFSYLVNLPMAV